MKIIRYLVFMLLSISAIIRGQNSPSILNHHIEYSVGFSQIKEENLIPKVHSGLSHFLEYELEIRNNAYQLYLKIVK